MHVALAAMWALLFARINPWLGALGTAYTVVIWIGSFHLGWHYAVDGLASSALVVALWLAVSVGLRTRTHAVPDTNTSVVNPAE